MSSAQIRPPAVAGMFYPGDPAELAADLNAMLRSAQPTAVKAKALIVPHAGYIYSGPVAASAYALLAPMRGTVTRVVLFGPTHRVAVQGLAVPTSGYFATPLGTIPLDMQAIEQALRLPQVQASDRAHAQEHSLEVQLPFLQSVLGDFSLVPFAVGDASGEEVAQVMEAMWGGPETLVVVSSDLSHFHAYATATQLDRHTVDAIVGLHLLRNHDQACGATPINGLLTVAQRLGLQAQLLDLRNSGDTAGDKARVVGYAAVAFMEPNPADATEQTLGAALLVRARNAIATELGLPAQPEAPHHQLAQPGATFVTLTQNGELRGCIGSLEAWRALDADVRANACAAALRDPRFAPLTRDELPLTRVEVSLLAPAQEMTFTSEDDVIRQLRPRIDGVILEYGRHRGTFLPQVWESLPEPREFLAHLKQKAGLAGSFWAADIKLSRYEVKKWKEAATH